MLQSHVYFTKHEGQNTFEKISGSGLIACVWELEIMWHEKKSWTKHYLQKIEKPDFYSYLQDQLQAVI
ncbi:MAG: hypothetical protein P1U56_24815 [Saprospiraceae bacterium]|nr:hypothetical protein [Saprospiraceae bacterium]